MKKSNILLIAGLAIGMLMTACSKESTPDTPKDNVKLERAIYDTHWNVPGDKLPTPEMQAQYENMEFLVDENLSFTWKWNAKPGKPGYEMKGIMYYEKTSKKHTSGSDIHTVYLYISHINGQELPGAFTGISAFENENEWTMNVEPDVSNWGKHPNPDEGIGSGENGDKSVYRWQFQGDLK